MPELEECTHLLAEPPCLREQAGSQGCLFFQQLLPAETIEKVRIDILGLCRDAGWLQPGAPWQEGVARTGFRCVEPEPVFMEVYNRLQKLESFHALAHQPALLRVFDTLFGEKTLVHARNIARIVFPQNVAHTTPAHQDFIHVQGTEETWTAWFPLSDCPREMGSLAILPGSHRQGVYPTHAALGAGGAGIDTDDLPFEWREADFRQGDVVVFHSLTIHKALPNLTSDRLRLSVDFRYQPLSHPITEGSLLPHHGQVGWEEVYAGWRSQEYQYYWKDLPISLVPWTLENRQARSAGY